MTTQHKPLQCKALLKGVFASLLITAALSLTVSAQSKSPAPPQPKASEQPSTDPNRVYSVVEKLPHFKGGNPKLWKYLEQNIKYPAADRENNIQGKVVVQFVVERDGRITGIKTVRTPTEDMAKEAVRVISQSPKWTPGMQNGKAVRSAYILPVSFVLAKG